MRTVRYELLRPKEIVVERKRCPVEIETNDNGRMALKHIR